LAAAIRRVLRRILTHPIARHTPVQPFGSALHVFNHFVVSHVRIEIDERGDRAGLDDCLVDLAPGETLDGADISPTGQNQKFNFVADQPFAELSPRNPGTRASSDSTFRRK
jgi:hypothetical protein